MCWFWYVVFQNSQGGSVLRGVDADMYITGELGHHEILHATRHKDACCLLVEHSNSERGFLKEVLAQRLSQELQKMDHDGSVLVSQMDVEPIQLFLAK
jgi:putative NIF3 family GTP cyclohydrolase 1 type 2